MKYLTTATLTAKRNTVPPNVEKVCNCRSRFITHALTIILDIKHCSYMPFVSDSSSEGFSVVKFVVLAEVEGVVLAEVKGAVSAEVEGVV